MYVADILKAKGGKVISLPSTEPLATAVKMLAEHRIGAVLVVDVGGGIAGILSERDIVRALHAQGDSIFTKKVGEIMTTEVVTCDPKDPVAAIMGMMTAQRFRHVPVVEEGKLIGMISIGDVVKSRIEEAQAEVEALRHYISL
ncbi:MAG: CBS domain-containing protein [Rhodospirillales bacterium]